MVKVKAMGILCVFPAASGLRGARSPERAVTADKEVNLRPHDKGEVTHGFFRQPPPCASSVAGHTGIRTHIQQQTFPGSGGGGATQQARREMVKPLGTDVVIGEMEGQSLERRRLCQLGELRRTLPINPVLLQVQNQFTQARHPAQ
jgi:hypothetical protein